MRSPLPGMDPYLEGSSWMNFHAQLSAEIARQLVPKLRPKYVALLTERFILESVGQLSVEIRDRAARRLVTEIELLSPTNKRGSGRDEYMNKRQQILDSSAHLLEIDLLRHGQRVPMRQPLPSTPYFIFLSRAELRPMSDIWPIALESPLPTVPVPLLHGDPDVALDLQAALTSVYDACGYDYVINYRIPPEIPLASEQMTWVENRLRAAHLRP